MQPIVTIYRYPTRKGVSAVGAPIEVRPFVATGKAEDHFGETPGA